MHTCSAGDEWLCALVLSQYPASVALAANPLGSHALLTVCKLHGESDAGKAFKTSSLI